MSRLAEAMQQDLESLAESRLTSPEIMEKMDRIAELMKQAQSGSMEEMLAKLRDQLEQMSSKELSLTMEDLNRNQTEMMRRLDTARSMLEDLARDPPGQVHEDQLERKGDDLQWKLHHIHPVRRMFGGRSVVGGPNRVGRREDLCIIRDCHGVRVLGLNWRGRERQKKERHRQHGGGAQAADARWR